MYWTYYRVLVPILVKKVAALGGIKFEVNLLKKLRVEIAVNDDFVDKAVKAITAGARTGEIGDGKIFVIALDRCVRIRTGQEGKEAIG